MGATTTACLFNIGYNKVEQKLISAETLIVTGNSPKFFVNNAMKHGNIYEKTALDLFSKKFDVKVKECGMTLNKRYRGIFGCSPDGVFNQMGQTYLIEIKCPYIKPDATEEFRKEYLSVEGYPKKKIDQQLTKLGKSILNIKDKRKAYNYAKNIYLQSCAYGVLPMHWLQMLHQFASTGNFIKIFFFLT